MMCSAILKDMPLVRQYASRVLQHFAFELCSSFLVVMNAITIGMQADWAMKNAGDDVPYQICHRFIDLRLVFFLSNTPHVRIRVKGGDLFEQ